MNLAAGKGKQMYTVSEILSCLDEKKFEYVFQGDRNDPVEGFSSLRNYKEGTITWIRDKRILGEAAVNNIRCIVVQEGIEVDAPNQIITKHSKQVFFAVLKEFWGKGNSGTGISEDAYISPGVSIAEGVSIGRNCVLDGDISIGKGTVIESNVVMMNKVSIGSNCMIHSGCVFGKDGFGYAFGEDGTPDKVEHFGGVTIGNNVEIGANVVVDRGTIDDTCIGNDTKIDSHSLIAHNAVIGSKTLILGGIVVGGSCRIGDGSYIAPGAMIKNQVAVGSNSFVGMGVTVNCDMGDDEVWLAGKEQAMHMKNYKRFL